MGVGGLRGGEGPSKEAPDEFDRVRPQRPRAGGECRDSLWAVNEDSVYLYSAKQGESFDVWEAQGPSDVNRGIAVELCKCAADRGDLLLGAGDQLRLVPAVDAKDGASLGEQAAGPVSADLAAVGLGVNDGYPAGADCDVIDIRLAVPRYPTVVQKAYICAVKQLL